MAARVYILDDDPVFAQLLKGNLGHIGEFRTRIFDDAYECLEAIAEEPPDALLTDLRMPDLSGVEVTRAVREQSRHMPIFLFTAHGEIESAVEALKAGANEYLLKPLNVTELATLLRKALDNRPLLEEGSSIRRTRREKFALKAILGDHALVEQTREFARRVGTAGNVSVLLLGESGVGKNLVAKAIHYADPNNTGRFVELNCGAIPDTLIEAELFGYMKGAFTDARQNKQGLVEAADGGTLFLDEIGELPPATQVKLLNFLESRRFRRLGGTRDQEVDVRVVTATNRPLADMMREGTFREDLFYRISVASHTLPPLRAILSDLPQMAERFVEEFATQMGKNVRGLTPGAISALSSWHWPGNVRELRNVIERAMIFAEAGQLGASDLPPLQGAASAGGVVPQGLETNEFAIQRGLTLKEAEAAYLRNTLATSEDSVAEIAKSLGISRKNLWERKKRHGLD